MSTASNGRHQAADILVNGWCVHCYTRRQMKGAIQVCNRRGGRDLKGHCNVCGKSMYRQGGWESVVAATQTAQAAEYSANVRKISTEADHERSEYDQIERG